MQHHLCMPNSCCHAICTESRLLHMLAVTDSLYTSSICELHAEPSNNRFASTCHCHVAQIINQVSISHPGLCTILQLPVLWCAFRFELEAESGSIPSVPASFLRRHNVPPTLAASREALGVAGVPDSAIAEEASAEVPRSSRRLQPIVQRSDSARLRF